MDYKELGMLTKVLIELLEEGDYDRFENPEKFVVLKLKKKIAELKGDLDIES